MSVVRQLLMLMFAGLLATACSGTKTNESWVDQNFKGRINNVYIIGLATKKENRMIFEDTFQQGLAQEGVKAVSSYRDLPTGEKADKELIIQRMRANNCDTVLLTRLVSERKVASFSGGGGSPGGFVATNRPTSYNNWGSYYTYARSIDYSPPGGTVDIVLLTVESVMYDLHTEKMIWSAQLETYLEKNIQDMMQKFVNEVIKDMKEKGLI